MTKVAEKTQKVTETVVDETRFENFMNHQRSAVSETSKALVSLLPEGFREHGQAAVREMVDGYRDLFNATLDDVVKNIEKIKIKKEA